MKMMFFLMIYIQYHTIKNMCSKVHLEMSKKHDENAATTKSWEYQQIVPRQTKKAKTRTSRKLFDSVLLAVLWRFINYPPSSSASFSFTGLSTSRWKMQTKCKFTHFAFNLFLFLPFALIYFYLFIVGREVNFKQSNIEYIQFQFTIYTNINWNCFYIKI